MTRTETRRVNEGVRPCSVIVRLDPTIHTMMLMLSFG